MSSSFGPTKAKPAFYRVFLIIWANETGGRVPLGRMDTARHAYSLQSSLANYKVSINDGTHRGLPGFWVEATDPFALRDGLSHAARTAGRWRLTAHCPNAGTFGLLTGLKYLYCTACTPGETKDEIKRHLAKVSLT